MMYSELEEIGLWIVGGYLLVWILIVCWVKYGRRLKK